MNQTGFEKIRVAALFFWSAEVPLVVSTKEKSKLIRVSVKKFEGDARDLGKAGSKEIIDTNHAIIAQ